MIVPVQIHVRDIVCVGHILVYGFDTDLKVRTDCLKLTYPLAYIIYIFNREESCNDSVNLYERFPSSIAVHIL